MIYRVHGNIFHSGAGALVIPVNCIGVAGAGMAKEAKELYPQWFQDYKEQCSAGKVQVGTITAVTVYDTLFINFPTKTTWKNPSDIAYIDTGLQALAQFLNSQSLASIAIPPLGCGLGGLPVYRVEKLIYKYLIKSTIPAILYYTSERSHGTRTP